MELLHWQVQRRKYYFWICSIVLVLVGIIPRLINIDAPILDIHSFRQTQTAITVREFSLNGVEWFNYTTPVLGKPFTLPFEFPVYQYTSWLVLKAGVTDNIDIACRIASLIYYVITLLLLPFILYKYFRSRIIAFAGLAFVTLVPFSIYWSRSVSIEFCAIAFSLAFLLSQYYFILHRNLATRIFALILAVLTGILACLVKLTTFFPYLIVLFLIVLPHFYSAVINQIKQEKNEKLTGELVFILTGLFCSTLLPIFLTYLWVQHSDELKSYEAAAFAKSSALSWWTYGTLEQRLDFAIWYDIFKRLIVTFIPYFLILAFLRFKKFDKRSFGPVAIICVAIFAAPATFFNLYYIHSYYLCALLPLFAALAGLIFYYWFIPFLSGLTKFQQIAMIFFAICLTVIQYAKNENTQYLAYLSKSNTPVEERYITLQIADQIQQFSSPEDLVMITGDWTSEFLYYSNRKGLMLRSDRMMSDEESKDYGLIVIRDTTAYPELLKSKNLKLLHKDSLHNSYFSIVKYGTD